MNINPLNINHNTNKVNPSFKRVQFQGELSKVFAEPKYAMPFVEGLKKLQSVKLNLKEILHYDKQVGLYKMILDDFFKFIGKDEVEDYTVTMKIEPDSKWGYYKTVLYGASPVCKENSDPCAENKTFSHNHKLWEVGAGYDDTSKFLSTGYDCRETIGMPGACELKFMLLLSFDRGIRSICDAIECNMDYIHSPAKFATKEGMFKKLQLMANQEDEINPGKEGSDISKFRILQNAYHVYDSTVYRVPAAEYMIKRLFKNAGIDSKDTQSYSTRVKGEGNIDSIASKMSRCMESSEPLRNSVKSGNYKDVMNYIYDIYGARLNATSEEEINRFFNEFTKFVKAGYIVPIQVNNYHGEGIEPLLSPEQTNKLEQITKSLGLDTKYCNTVLKNGYTTVNIRTELIIEEDTTLPVEFQISTRDINKFRTIAHCAYDVMSGKDILSGYDSKRQEILKPLINNLLIIMNDKKLGEKYGKYINRCFYVARNGSSDFPSASEYGLPEEVSCANMFKIQQLLHMTDEELENHNKQIIKPNSVEEPTSKTLFQKIMNIFKF